MVDETDPLTGNSYPVMGSVSDLENRTTNNTLTPPTTNFDDSNDAVHAQNFIAGKRRRRRSNSIDMNAPLLHRSKTFADASQVDLSRPISVAGFSVNNPVNLERRLSVFPGNDYEELYKRLDSLKSMRPERLIGDTSGSINWEDYRMDDKNIRKLKRSLRNFYYKQNDIISMYEDIDLLLDTGVQFEMLQNYADNTSSDNSESELIDEELSATNMTPQDDSQMSNLTFSKKKKPANLNSTPGNIDLEGAKILGTGEDSTSNIVMYAIYFNFLLNVVLLLGKVLVVYLSNSLSLIASLVDSALDFLSTMIIFVANRYAVKKSRRFPVGRKQLEPIGVLIFSIVIILSFAQVLIESIKQLFNSGPRDDAVKLSNTSIGIMVGTILTKMGAYIICESINNSSVQALVEDAKTDIVFNFFSLIFPTVGFIFNFWWLDALGASILCCYVISQWGMVTLEHVDHLSGSHASKENYQQVLYLIMRFSKEISRVKNYRMYHLGDLVNVEVDVVLKNPKMELKDYHDLGESLQYAIETLPYVNRCFVHIDYKVHNYIGHLS